MEHKKVSTVELVQKHIMDLDDRYRAGKETKELYMIKKECLLMAEHIALKGTNLVVRTVKE